MKKDSTYIYLVIAVYADIDKGHEVLKAYYSKDEALAEFYLLDSNPNKDVYIGYKVDAIKVV